MAINVLVRNSYSGNMVAKKAIPTQRRQTAKPAAATPIPKVKPNRITELAKERGLTYPAIADAIGAHDVTIAKLANGQRRMNEDWQRKLADLFRVPFSDVMEKPAARGLKRIEIMLPLQAGAWAETHEYDPELRDSVMVPLDPALDGLELYAARIVGDSMDKVYPDGSVVVLSRCGQRAADIIPGKRYHIRITRMGGQVEETIKTLVKGSGATFWMQPESNSPEYHSVQLHTNDEEQVDIVGRVRYSVRKEE